MKIIHCADLHLDSKMTTHLSGAQLRRRRAELLHTFTRMVEYAGEQDVKAILICGDLFDTKNISAQARNTVYETICRNPEIGFFYLAGNHEETAFVEWMPSVPENLHIFGTEWTAFQIGSVSIEGTDHFTEVPLPSTSAEGAVPGDEKNRTRINTFRIVALHGQLSEYGGAEPESLNLQLLRNRGIDYLALGHIHTYKKGELAPKGIWCYSGALEGRGFDECGPHGFVLLDIDEETGTCRDSFVPFASRRLWELPVDISGTSTTVEIIARIGEMLNSAEELSAGDLVRVVLKGRLDVCDEKNTAQIMAHFGDRFALFQVRDETKLDVNYLSYEHDASLKGELVRLLQRDPELSEDEKAEIVRCGLQALSGEEFEF